MPVIQTPHELGLAIRSQRKALRWDQATLAVKAGVSRQWVIDIEKGKPRAELALAMRALRVLGLVLIVESRTEADAPSDADGTNNQARLGIPRVGLAAIVERNRGKTAKLPDALAKTRETEAKKTRSRVGRSGSAGAKKR